MKIDSTHKILGYIESASYPKFIISKLFFRSYTCPVNCGGCCPKFSLDYFEGERWERFKETYSNEVHKFGKREVNGATVYTYAQLDHKGAKCSYLNLENGRCNIHRSNPFSCEFELMKFMNRPDSTVLINKLFGRGWNMKRVDGKRGALCEMLDYDSAKCGRDILLLKELRGIANNMNIKNHRLDLIIEMVEKCKDKLDQGYKMKKNIIV